MNSYKSRLTTALALLAGVLLSACPKSSPPASNNAASQSVSKSASPTAQQPPAGEQPLATPPEQPVEPEHNPPGDIPDTQVFITYANEPGMYSIKAPEGWARTETGGDVKFVDKFDGEQVAVSQASAEPTVESIKAEQVSALEKTGRAVNVTDVQSKQMPDGLTAICVKFTSNSEPDPVTNKQVRLENETYYYYAPGMLAALTLWAPQGADNVDQWKLISESFAWTK